MRDPSFAPATNDIRKGILDAPLVTRDPSPGQGYSLDERASVPLVVRDGSYSLAFVTVNFDGGNTGPGGTSLYSVTAPTGTCNVGDYAIAMGPAAAQGLIWFGGGPITAADTLVVRAFNPTGSGINPTATDITWAVFKAERA